MKQQRDDHLAENAWKNDGSDHRVRFDPTSESVSETVALAVSRAVGASPTGISPLHDAVDPDALDALFTIRCAESGRPPEWSLAFTYADCLVRVYSAGYVTVTRPDE